MSFQSIQFYHIIILSFSVVVFVFFTLFKLFRLNGFIIYLSSLVLYIASILLKNIYFQFLGVSILFAFCLFSIYYSFIYIIYKNKGIIFSSFSAGTIYPFENVSITIKGANLPVPFPGIFHNISYVIYENGNIIGKKLIPVNSIEGNNVNCNITFNRHGLFLLKDFCFIFSDVFGFTKYSFNVSFQYSVRVYPFFTESLKIPFFLDKGGEEILQSVVKIDSTDFYENRKYYPGDDTRRINWKIFAHSGELHIREVEKIPPKIGEITLLFAPYSDNIFEYEHITSLFLATVHYLLNYDFQLKIYSPVSNNATPIDKTKENDFNFIINSSYRLFNNNFNISTENVVIFSSFFEYKRLLKNIKIKKSYSAVSYSEKQYTLKDIFRSFMIVKKDDNLLNELYHIYYDIKKHRKRNGELQDIIDLSRKKRVELSLYTEKPST